MTVKHHIVCAEITEWKVQAAEHEVYFLQLLAVHPKSVDSISPIR